MDHSLDISVSGTKITDQSGEVGVDVFESQNVSFRNCDVSRDSGGFKIDNSRLCTFTNNSICNDEGQGILLINSANATLYSNQFIQCGLEIEGLVADDFVSHTISTNNSVNGAPLYCFQGASGSLAADEPAGQVIVVGCNNASVSDVSLSQGSAGLEACYCEGLLLRNITVSDQGEYGVYLVYCDETTLSSINITNCQSGIVADHCSNLKLTNCCAVRSAYKALLIRSCHSVTAIDDCFSGCPIGVDAFESPGLRFLNSSVIGATLDGMCIYSCPNSVFSNITVNLTKCSAIQVSYTAGFLIENSTVAENQDGVVVDACTAVCIRNNTFVSSRDAVYLKSTTSGCRVYHNNFLDSWGLDDNGGNQWDDGYPAGGNHWGGLSWPDVARGRGQDQQGSDGIVDVPVNIASAGCKDRYPLSFSWGPRAPPLVWIDYELVNGANLTNFLFSTSNCSDRNDPPGVLLVRWDWEDDGIWDTNWTNTTLTFHDFGKPGNYSVRLEVMNSQGQTFNSTMTLTVPRQNQQIALINPPAVRDGSSKNGHAETVAVLGAVILAASIIARSMSRRRKDKGHFS